MTTILRTMICMAAALACALPMTSEARNKRTAKGKLARVIKNQDGSITEFKSESNNRVLEKVTYVEKANGERIVQSRTVYRRNKFGKLVSGSIFDGQGVKLFRMVYGYHNATGRLVGENMFDARVKRLDPKAPKKEMPIRALRYTYDAHGNRSKPIIFVAIPGGTIEEFLKDHKDRKAIRRSAFGEDGSTISADPFEKEAQPVNPNSRRTGQ